jgi:hypothetical protein
MLRPSLALTVLSLTALAVSQTTPRANCKVAPSDRLWPSIDDWAALNSSISGALIKTAPVASSCFTGSPFNSTVPCATVKAQWANSTFHRLLPESIDFPIFANRSCIPDGQTGGGVVFGGTCTLGAYPAYVVKATGAPQIATALKWAAERFIRVVIKGTGHDLAGR